MSSNVHRLGDYSDGGPQGQAFPQQQGGQRIQQRGGGGGRQMMLGGGGLGGEGGYPPLNKVFAPNFNPLTFIFVVSVIQVIMFIAELFVGQLDHNGAFVEGNDMAGPSTGTMIDMGAKWLPLIRNGEIFRFITPAFLHAGVLHIFTNLFSQTMIGYTAELDWGWKVTAFFYFMTAFGASLMSCVAAPCVVSVGASGALLGIIGARMGFYMVRWNSEPGACPRLCNLIWWVFIIFMIGISVKGIDNWAHFGGWLTGMLLSFAFTEYNQPLECIANREKCWKYSNMALSVSFFLITLICTFTVLPGSC